MLYNDAYSVFAGGRHPELLGSKVLEGWPEVADFNDDVMKVGLPGGRLAYKDHELTLYRHGMAKQVWMNLDYSPVLDQTGEPAGVIAVVVETTDRVKADERLKTERERLLQAFEQAPAFIISMRGSARHIEFVNVAHRRAFSSHDWTGKTIRDAFPDVADQGYFAHSCGLCHCALRLTHAGDSQMDENLFRRCREMEACDGGSDWGSIRLHIVDHCCFAWNKLVDQPWRIMSIGMRQWAHGY